MSMQIGRTPSGIVVSVSGACDRPALATVELVLRDLIEGQGNGTVTIDAANLAPGESGLDRVLARLAEVARRCGTRLRVDGAVPALAPPVRTLPAPDPVVAPGGGLRSTAGPGRWSRR